MKKTGIYILLFAILSAFISCKSTQTVQKSEGSNEIIVPLSGKEYQSTKELFRSKASGKSPDLTTAKKIALNNAKAEMAGLIKATIKTVTDNYTNQRGLTNATEFENKFETMTREVVNQQLVDVNVIGEKIFKEKDGSFTYWVAIEASKDAILNGLNQNITKDKKLQIDYDKKKFEETFNKEMENFEKNK